MGSEKKQIKIQKLRRKRTQYNFIKTEKFPFVPEFLLLQGEVTCLSHLGVKGSSLLLSAMWPIKLELIQVSVARSNLEYRNPPSHPTFHLTSPFSKPIPIYTPGWREVLSSKVFCLKKTQEHSQLLNLDQTWSPAC